MALSGISTPVILVSRVVPDAQTELQREVNCNLASSLSPLSSLFTTAAESGIQDGNVSRRVEVEHDQAIRWFWELASSGKWRNSALC